MDWKGGQVKRILVLQLVSAIVLSIVASLWGAWIGRSAGIGAGIAFAANGLFAYRLFRPDRADALHSLRRRVYGAVFLKITLALLLFGIALSTVEPLSVPILILAYAAVQLFPPMIASFWKRKE